MDSFRVLKTRRIRNITAFRFGPVRPSRINGATGGRPLIEFENLDLTGRPVAATCRPFRVNTENPSNRQVNFANVTLRSCT